MNQKDEIPMSVHKALKRFEKAAVAESWRGSQNPSHWPKIRQEYEGSKASLLAKIKKAIIQNQEKSP